jgi:ubiquinone/menaquinone biosynthesis C-methylase UbiE
MPARHLGFAMGLLALTLAVRLTAPASAQAQGTGRAASPAPKAAPGPDQDKPKTGQEPARPKARRARSGFYMGRRIADVMSWQGAEWLFRETRVDEEQPAAMLDALKIPPGSTVADVGAGAGYHTIPLARRVGPDGIVLATDVQPEMLQMLKQRAQAEGISNIKPLLCSQRDTKLPDGRVDLVLMVDVYHECSDPEATLLGLHKALRPGGRLVLVEFRGEDPEVPIKPEHKMTVKQVRREVEPQGFTFKTSLEFLPWQHVVIFEKPAAQVEGKKDKTETKPGSAPPIPRR